MSVCTPRIQCLYYVRLKGNKKQVVFKRCIIFYPRNYANIIC